MAVRSIENNSSESRPFDAERRGREVMFALSNNNINNALQHLNIQYKDAINLTSIMRRERNGWRLVDLFSDVYNGDQYLHTFYNGQEHAGELLHVELTNYRNAYSNVLSALKNWGIVE